MPFNVKQAIRTGFESTRLHTRTTHFKVGTSYLHQVLPPLRLITKGFPINLWGYDSTGLKITHAAHATRVTWFELINKNGIDNALIKTASFSHPGRGTTFRVFRISLLFIHLFRDLVTILPEIITNSSKMIGLFVRQSHRHFEVRSIIIS